MLGHFYENYYRKIACVESLLFLSIVNLSPLDLFRAGHAAKSSILCFAWMTACISYYALTLNSTQLTGHIVINFALIGVTELPVPVILLLTLNQIGRRPMAVLGHLVLGMCGLALAFIPKGWLF